uniref:Peptidase S33 tripeptidyl aminopeptidase-like C-terminal domain-containing protein n=1 Tax=Mycena chlorophos TaxID=658473 RepID=A0ABQ0LUW8_MYCCL|nr:predicted protein [Mycena chlorophos]
MSEKAAALGRAGAQRRAHRAIIFAFLFLVLLPVETWKHQTLIREWIQRGVGNNSPLMLSRPNSTLQWTACPDNSTFYCTFFKVPLDYDAPDDQDNVVLAMRVPLTLSRPNSTLEWTACPDNSTFYCTFFEVPLDYDVPDDPDTDPDNVVLAMRVFPATVPVEERLGSIFMNPGGPGGSGHASLLRTGPLLSGIIAAPALTWARVQPTPERYDGPWKIGVDLRRPKFPVAFVSNSFDPITPINNAVRMVDLLGVENARLLHNNAYGHCSTNHPSLCVAKHIRAYMTDGIVFENGTLCEPEPGFVFPDPGSDPKERVAELQIYSEQDKKLVETLRQLAEAGLGHPYLR